MAKLDDLQLGKTKKKEFKFTRQTDDGPKEVTVLVTLLTPLELDRARVNAAVYIDTLDPEKKASDTREDLLRDAEEIECLSMSLRDPEKPEEVWAGPNSLRRLLTTTELALLYRAYLDHMENCGPIFRKMSPEKYEAMIALVAKEATADPFVLFDSHTQKDFLVTTVCELVTLRMARSSPTSELTEPEAGSSSNTEVEPEAAAHSEDT